MGSSHFHRSEGRSGTKSYVFEVRPLFRYFLGHGIPFLNWQVEVEYLFLELFYSSVSLHRVILHYYRYLTRTAEITILELTAN